MELDTKSNAFCASDLSISNTNNANNEFIYLTNVTDNDSIFIINSQISSPNLNAFISGYSAWNKNSATIKLQQLLVSNFGTTFINLDDINNKLFNINFSDSLFTNNSQQLIYVNTLSNTSSLTFDFNNITFEDVVSPNNNLFDINSNGGTQIDVNVDELIF